MPYQKVNVEVKVPHRSGFDMSHRNTGTETCGTLQPLLVEEVIPNVGCSLKVNIVTQMPPLVSDTYMNVQKRVEAFFVPMRLLCKSFEDWFCDFPKRVATFSSDSVSSPITFSDVKAALPVFRFNNTMASLSSVYGPCSLLDYLGFKISNIAVDTDISPLSLIAYHLIWQEFYRNPKVQNPAFADDLGVSSSQSPVDNARIACLPFKYFHHAFTGASAGSTPSTSWPDNSVILVSNSRVNSGVFNLADGVSIFDLRQRNFGFDFFTSCRPSAQQGNAAQVSFTTAAQGADSSFTIAQLRAANSLQMFRERNNIPSPRLVDQVKARYGANLSDGVAQRPICIGSAVYDVVTRGVDQTGEVTNGDNPYNSVASQYGRAYGVGSDFIIDNFVTSEPGFVMVLQSLVPVVTYASGIAPYLRRYVKEGSVVEMANPILQNIGDEEVYSSQIVSRVTQASDLNTIFGYNDRYGSFMYHPNEVHGKMRYGQDLDAFVLQRSFSQAPVLGSQFLEIPKSFMDPVFAAATAVTGVSAWYDAKLEWKLSMPLQEFCVPSLQDPAYEHGDTVYLRRNGQIF